ncbi:MAG: hypothetical protein NC118_14040 [Eubacterium sp.]|nr:hypothetical protein [Eubacterium sp.]
MTPAEYNKQATILLSELLVDTGFSKKRICMLSRKTKECTQHLSFWFTRNRGLPGNLYSVNPTLSFTFTEVDKLTSRFLGTEYDAKWSTGTQPLYTVIPGNDSFRFRYCSDEPLDQYTKRVAEDFCIYALPYFEKYDTLEKLEIYLEQNPIQGIGKGGFRVVRSGGSEGGRGCCYAAVLCLLKKWDKLRRFVESTDQLFPEQKERIIDYVSNK